MQRRFIILALLLFAGNSAFAAGNPTRREWKVDGGTPVATYIHSGGHQLPDDVPPVIVKFFKQNPEP